MVYYSLKQFAAFLFDLQIATKFYKDQIKL